MASGITVLARPRVMSMGEVDAHIARLRQSAAYEKRPEKHAELRTTIAVLRGMRVWFTDNDKITLDPYGDQGTA